MDLISPDIVCRVCSRSDTRNNLITPCRCQGDKSFAHRSCMITTLRDGNTRRCKDCTFHMKVKISRLKLSKWTLEPQLRAERLHIFVTFSIHFYTSMVLMACALTLIVQYATEDERLSFSGLIKLVTGIVLFLGLLIFLLYQLPYYYRIFNTLRCYNNPVTDVSEYTPQRKSHKSKSCKNTTENSIVSLLTSKFHSGNRVSTVSSPVLNLD